MPQNTMSSKEFSEGIAGGRQLVILDELVLDCTRFVDQHPGGRFCITHNVGRDISKFFYGGYSLEDNLNGGLPARGYNHSTYARAIVNELAVARYQYEIEVSTTICHVREDLNS